MIKCLKCSKSQIQYSILKREKKTHMEFVSLASQTAEHIKVLTANSGDPSLTLGG